jgi:hypothetical protein
MSTRVVIDIPDGVLDDFVREVPGYLPKEKRNDPLALKELCEFLVIHLSQDLETSQKFHRHLAIKNEDLHQAWARGIGNYHSNICRTRGRFGWQS